VLAAAPELAPRHALVIALSACLAHAGAPLDAPRKLVLDALDALRSAFLTGAAPPRLLSASLGGDAAGAAAARQLMPHLLTDLLALCNAPPLSADVAPASLPGPPQPRPPPPASELDSLPPWLARQLAPAPHGALLAAALRAGVCSSAHGCHVGDLPGESALDFGVQRCGGAASASASPYAALLPPPPLRVLHRALRLRNTSSTPALLLSLRLEPSDGPFAVHDDFAMSSPHAPAGVLLPPGGVYELTLRLTCAPGDAGGVVAAWLLATLAPAAASPPVDAALDATFPLLASAANVALPPPAKAFVIGRRVTAAVLSDAHAAAVRACFAFNPDAKPFVPAALRRVFDAPTAHFLTSHVRAAALGAWLHAAITALTPCCEETEEDGEGTGGGGGGTYAAAPEALRRGLRSLSRLLRLEEAAQTRALRSYDLHSVHIMRVREPPGAKPRKGAPPLFALRVPGLPEARPALSVGDFVHLRTPATPGFAEVAACVHAVQLRDATVHLALPPECSEALGAGRDAATLSVHVRFTLDRTLFGRASEAMHAELAAAAAVAAETAAFASAPMQLQLPPPPPPRPALLPTMRPPPFAPRAPPLTRQQLAPREGPPLNEEQADAVLSVLNGHADGAPHVLYGPPGTGKTLTVVEAARQLLHASPTTRLLLCAPSPFAADILCSRLVSALAADDAAAKQAAQCGIVADDGFRGARVARINDPRRDEATVKEDVRALCVVWTLPDFFKLPPSFVKAGPPVRVFVATCASAALLRRVKHMETLLPFAAVLIDEAGQGTAPESLCALCAPLTSGRTAILLAGDPRQLGPIVHSRTAVAAGMARSLLERFADAEAHAGGGGGGGDGRRRVTRLTRNYRSHADVLSLPSALFYGAALRACADEASTSLPGAWHDAHGGADGSARQRCRVHFHGVRGEQCREADAPSWFNAVEAATVVDVVTGLLSHGLCVGDIGVIATFRKQVQKLRELLRRCGLGAVRVGTVDDYQGQEERVIVISTVVSRTSKDAEDDGSGGGGGSSFLANARRFNVAVSRARALNIVVGHPVPLAQWPHWRALMRHALARDAFTGAGAAGLDGGDSGDGGDADGDALAATVAALAEATLLGAGHDEARGDEDDAAGGNNDVYDERGWRVAL
jgi:putative helicase MOV10L1